MKSPAITAFPMAKAAVLYFALGIVFCLLEAVTTLVPQPDPQVWPFALALVSWLAAGVWLLFRYDGWRRFLAIVGLVACLVLGLYDVDRIRNNVGEPSQPFENVIPDSFEHTPE